MLTFPAKYPNMPVMRTTATMTGILLRTAKRENQLSIVESNFFPNINKAVGPVNPREHYTLCVVEKL
jgi:hypothetical protein